MGPYWLGREDSNPCKQIQSLPSCLWTTPQQAKERKNQKVLYHITNRRNPSIITDFRLSYKQGVFLTRLEEGFLIAGIFYAKALFFRHNLIGQFVNIFRCDWKIFGK